MEYNQGNTSVNELREKETSKFILPKISDVPVPNKTTCSLHYMEDYKVCKCNYKSITTVV